MTNETMYNGATVADWLGTAALAARGAAGRLEGMRENPAYLSETALRMAADDAAQALQEIATVMDHFGFAHGYGLACTFGREER